MILERATREQLKWMKQVYLRSFPKIERKPFWLMKRKQKQGIYEMLVVCDEKPLGFAITVQHKDLVLLDYFAIAPEEQNKGIGSKTLELLGNRYEGRRFFLEIELLDEKADNSEQRAKRKAFYLRNGMKETGIKADVAGTGMEVLAKDCKLCYEEYKGLYDFALGKGLSKRIVQPWKE